MIDLHCHILPGIDDGPETIEDSLALARAAVAEGIHTVVATPHVNARYPSEPDMIAELVEELNVRLVKDGIGLEVLPGAEIAVTHLAETEPAQLERLGLGGSRWLLVEPPFALVAVGLEGMVADLLHSGHRVVLAHPERCPALRRDQRMVASMAEAGVLMSVTAGSLTGRFGKDARRFAHLLAREGLIHNVTSDAHDHQHRPPGMTEAVSEPDLAPLAEWLTQAVPEAILADGAVPPRPIAVPRRSGRRSGRWRLLHRSR
jgi:protein-tyrosine phosphatase